MTVAELQRMRTGSVLDPERRSLPRPADGDDEGGFGKALDNAIGQVDADQKMAGEQINAFVAGEQENVHEVMISMNQAQLSLQLMTEVRNKMLETYQELMRMQV